MNNEKKQKPKHFNLKFKIIGKYIFGIMLFMLIFYMKKMDAHANAYEEDFSRYITINLNGGTSLSTKYWKIQVDRNGCGWTEGYLFNNNYIPFTGTRFLDRTLQPHTYTKYSNNTAIPVVGSAFYQHMDCVGVTPYLVLGTPVRSGYTFTGWTSNSTWDAEDVDGSGNDAFNVGCYKEDGTPSGNITITANWKINAGVDAKITATTTNWTNKTVTVKATATSTSAVTTNVKLYRGTTSGTLIANSSATTTVSATTSYAGTGTQRYTVVATNSSGKTDTATITVRVDKIKPVITIADVFGWTRNSIDVDPSISDAHSGISSSLISKGNFRPFITRMYESVHKVTPGESTIQAWYTIIEDKHYNKRTLAAAIVNQGYSGTFYSVYTTNTARATAILNAVMDTTPTSAQITAAKSAASSAGDSGISSLTGVLAVVNYGDSNNLLSSECYCPVLDNVNAATTETLISTEGITDVLVYAKDKAGNSLWKIVETKLDKTGPDIDISDVLGWTKNDIVIDPKVTDSLTNVVSSRVITGNHRQVIVDAYQSLYNVTPSETTIQNWFTAIENKHYNKRALVGAIANQGYSGNFYTVYTTATARATALLKALIYETPASANVTAALSAASSAGDGSVSSLTGINAIIRYAESVYTFPTLLYGQNMAANSDANVSYTMTNEGMLDVLLYASDSVGNSTYKIIETKLDKTAPVIIDADVDWTSNDIIITPNITDALSGINSSRIVSSDQEQITKDAYQIFFGMSPTETDIRYWFSVMENTHCNKRDIIGMIANQDNGGYFYYIYTTATARATVLLKALMYAEPTSDQVTAALSAASSAGDGSISSLTGINAVITYAESSIPLPAIVYGINMATSSDANVSYTMTDEGMLDVLIYANDLAGNSTYKIIKTKLDKTPPSITGNVSSTWSGSNVTVLQNITDLLSGVDIVNVSENGSTVLHTYNPSTGNLSFASSKEGINTYSVYATDCASPPNTISKTITVNIDKTGPVISGTTNYSWNNGTVNVSQIITDALSGVKTVTVKEGATTITSTYNSGTGALNFSSSAEGIHTYVVTATDNASPSNTTTKTITVNIDKTGPSTDATDSSWNPGNKTLTFNFSDTASGLQSIEFLDMATNTNIFSGVSLVKTNSNNWKLTYTFTDEKLSTYSFKMTDNAGNVSTKTFNVGIDKTKAVGIIETSVNGETTAYYGNALNETSIGVHFKANDDYSKILNKNVLVIPSTKINIDAVSYYYKENLSGVKTVKLSVTPVDGSSVGSVTTLTTFTANASNLNSNLLEGTFIINNFYNYYPDATQVKVQATITDNAGNSSVVETLVNNFFIKATIDRVSSKDGFSDADDVADFLAGEMAVINISTYGYVSNMDIWFDTRLENALIYQKKLISDSTTNLFDGVPDYKLGYNFNLTPKQTEEIHYNKLGYPDTYSNVYNGNSAEWDALGSVISAGNPVMTTTGYETYIPMYVDPETYTIEVTGTKGTAYQTIKLHAVVGNSLLSERRTRVRFQDIEPDNSFLEQ